MIKNVPSSLSIVEKTSKNGKPYNQIVLTIKGKEVNAGIVNVYVENALLSAGIDVSAN